MIKLLQHTSDEVAAEILSVSLAAYEIEAELLGLTTFPPLEELILDITTSKNEFWGIYLSEDLSGVIEIASAGSYVEICRLVVAPDLFRKGIASQLLNGVLRKGTLYKVSTATANGPAMKLYAKHGFEIVGRLIVEEGLELSCLELRL